MFLGVSYWESPQLRSVSVSISVSTRACHHLVRAKAGFDSQTESTIIVVLFGGPKFAG
jgi:hypothetical protein